MTRHDSISQRWRVLLCMHASMLAVTVRSLFLTYLTSGLDVLLEDRLSLTTETLLFTVVTTLT